MPRSKSLEDEFYDKQIARMSNLARFPLVPEAQKEIRRALRRISETDESFIRKLISDVVDTNTVCPKPAELLQRAGEMRHRRQRQETIGKPDCELCGGSGFIESRRHVVIKGVAEYDAEFAAPCPCRGT